MQCGCSLVAPIYIYVADVLMMMMMMMMGDNETVGRRQTRRKREKPADLSQNSKITVCIFAKMAFNLTGNESIHRGN
jgi:hypothetical protein